MGEFDSSDEENEQEFQSTKLDISWFDFSSYDCNEKLGISSLPGCRFKNTWRKLDSDIEQLKAEDVTVVYSLCTKGELKKYRVPSLHQKLQENDIHVHHYPFPDGQTPSFTIMMKIIDDIRGSLHNAKRCLIHCYGGLGRSCLVTMCLLMLLDNDIQTDDAVKQVKQTRGAAGALQTVKQFNFIHEFRENKQVFEKECNETSRSVSR